MLPALTISPRTWLARRWLPLVGSGLLFLAAILTAFSTQAQPTARASTPMPRLTEQLDPSTWAISVPSSWFATPLQGVQPGDRIDVVAFTGGPNGIPNSVAVNLQVMTMDGQSIVLGGGAGEVTALALARARGELIVPLVRARQ